MSQRALAWLWAALLLVCTALLLTQLRQPDFWDTRITALLPASDQSARLQRADNQLAGAFESQFVLLVGGPQPVAAARDLKQRLQAVGLSADQTDNRPDQQLDAYRYGLLSDELHAADSEQLSARALERLLLPGGSEAVSRDPFGVLDSWLQERFSGPLRLRQGMPGLQHDGQLWVLVSGQLQASPYALEVQQQLHSALAAFHVQWPEAQLLRSGLIFHAAAGATQAQREMSSLGLASVLGLCLLFWLVFRRLRTLALLLVPIACGLLLALPLTGLLFGGVNLLTLVFGVSIIGIAVDYALHLQCQRQLVAEQPEQRFWSALLLGLVTTLVAYLGQLLTPMPGLRQMACFAALGLLGAWLTVRLWLAQWPLSVHPATAAAARRLAPLRLREGQRWPWISLLVLLLLALAAISRLQFSGSLQQLNPSPPQLIAEQQQVQTLLQQPGGSRYLLVSAPDGQALLQRLESLDAPLQQLLAAGELSAYTHTARHLPSLARQQYNRHALRQGYLQALPALRAASGLPERLQQQAVAALDAAPLLTAALWLDSSAGAPDAALWLGAQTEGGWLAIIALGEASPAAISALQQLAIAPDLLYHDRVASLSAQLAHLARSMASWLALAVLLLGLLLCWRLRRAAWRALLPPVGAVVLTLGCLSLVGGIGLFHLLGLLLVLGIGLDAGIFSAQEPDSEATWLAVSLSCASSLLAFGLLAFSATPALHFLGLTCLLGLAFTWALVPFARAERPGFSH
ncbi:MAG: hypothetical protein V7756_15195 [Halopseudomonas sp.]|uniref:MMPL family transporter n=1 Tax=Halopseudomonas sp. TaxID=2901191 RepID=UPI00300182CF